jgi:flavin-dependent dehydrogenase
MRRFGRVFARTCRDVLAEAADVLRPMDKADSPVYGRAVGTSPSVAVIGAGMGGLAVAAALRLAGAEVTVYEQAARFQRIGAGIQMMPNSMKVLARIGVADVLRQRSFWPYSHLNRAGGTGEVMRELPMPESLFGAPYLCMHRGDLHRALASVLPDGVIRLGRKLTGLDQARGPRVRLSFADGPAVTADAVVGADGIHSRVRELTLAACPGCHKWAILEREPLPRWSDGPVVLLGDACHPMTPYMAQGAATAIEDAAVLARCITAGGAEDLPAAFRRYEAHRKPRTSRIQAISSANTWMQGGDSDPSWLYGYDAWECPLDTELQQPAKRHACADETRLRARRHEVRRATRRRSDPAARTLTPDRCSTSPSAATTGTAAPPAAMTTYARRERATTPRPASAHPTALAPSE